MAIRLALGFLLLAACVPAPRHFPDPEQEAERARLSALLDRLGEAPPVAGDELLRLVWQRRRGDDYVITAGVDQDAVRSLFARVGPSWCWLVVGGFV